MIKDLLVKWAELEPERCLPRNGFSCIVLINGTWREIHYDTKMVTDAALLQYAVQQAIVARGWSFDLKYNSHFRVYHATVDFRDNVGTFDNPAKAPTSAYVKALEAQGD